MSITYWQPPRVAKYKRPLGGTAQNLGVKPTTVASYDEAIGELSPHDPLTVPAQARRGLFAAASERRLMAEILQQAIDEARSSVLEERREAARAWLRAQPGFTARECCEALGIDYEATMKALERQWAVVPDVK